MDPRSTLRSLRAALAATLVLALTAGCGMAMHSMHHGLAVPPDSAFGLGPRGSAAGRFTATLTPATRLRTGALLSARLALRDPAGAPVSGARIAVDGGMPQHGHGLPTRPRVVAEEAGGVYVVDGLRFNMGGWWEVRFRVATAAASDSITFNVRL